MYLNNFENFLWFLSFLCVIYEFAFFRFCFCRFSRGKDVRSEREGYDPKIQRKKEIGKES